MDLLLAMNISATTTPKATKYHKLCDDNDDCSNVEYNICCGKKGYRKCRSESDCTGVPCSSSFECNDGKMWCCDNRCETSACLLPVWAIVLIVIAVTVIISVVFIYVIMECCRRWPGVQRTIC